MATSTRNYFRRLAEGYEDGPLSRALTPFLEIAGQVYGSIIGVQRHLFENNKLGRKKLGVPVISVGNLTWGGTGKTPFVEYLSRRISEKNKTPLILTRGYGADECEQFKHHLPKAVIGVGKDRVKVAAEIGAKQPVDIALLDDGLQHWAIERDLEIVMVNALNPFGNGKLLPRGILREPVQTLKRASVVVISHSNLVDTKDLEKIREQLRTHAPQALVVEAYLEPLFFYRAKKKGRVPLEKVQKQKVATFSGVGAPRSFQLVLSRLQIKPVRNFEFPDHHVFSDKELKEIKEVSDTTSVAEVVTTEKDFFRCPDKIAEILNPLILATRLRISSGEGPLNEKLTKLLEVART